MLVSHFSVIEQSLKWFHTSDTAKGAWCDEAANQPTQPAQEQPAQQPLQQPATVQ